MRHLSLRLLASVMLSCAALCTSAYGASQVLRVVPQADLKILDPTWTTAFVTRNHGFMIYDTLFGIDEQGRVQPQMVGNTETSKDLKVWTFTLRPGLAFHDDKPVTAEDVVASLNRWGKRDVFGQKLFGELERIEVLNSDTFRLSFKKSFPLVPEALAKAGPNVPFIMPKRVADTPADKQITDTTGSGPFIFKKDEYRPGKRVIYIKNMKYKPRSEPASGTAGGKQVFVDRVEWIILNDSKAQVDALINGQVDMIEFTPAEFYPLLYINKQIELQQLIPPIPFTAHYNHLIPPFDNPKIARAAIMAIDQKALMRSQMLFEAMYKTCLSIYPCGSPYASDKTAYFTGKPRFEEAKRLLQEAGYDGKPIVIMLPTDFAILNKFPAVYAKLLKQAGFNVDLQEVEWGTLLSRRAKKDPVENGGWNIFITGWGSADSISPVMYSPLTGSGVKGYFGWPKDDRLEALKTQFLEAPDEVTRKRLAEAIQLRSFEVGVIGPIGESTTPTAVRRGTVTGLLKAPTVLYWNIRKN